MNVLINLNTLTDKVYCTFIADGFTETTEMTKQELIKYLGEVK